LYLLNVPFVKLGSLEILLYVCSFVGSVMTCSLVVMY
jgi:hypothetical protein